MLHKPRLSIGLVYGRNILDVTNNCHPLKPESKRTCAKYMAAVSIIPKYHNEKMLLLHWSEGWCDHHWISKFDYLYCGMGFIHLFQ